MVKVTFLGREFDLKPYKLGAMIAAAPFIDSQRARSTEIEERVGVSISPSDTPEERASKLKLIGAATSMADTFASMADIISFLHVGIAAIDPTITVEMLIDDTDPTMERMSELMNAMVQVQRSGGLTAGEVKAPSATADSEAASSSNSAPSSSSSSQQE